MSCILRFVVLALHVQHRIALWAKYDSVLMCRPHGVTRGNWNVTHTLFLVDYVFDDGLFAQSDGRSPQSGPSGPDRSITVNAIYCVQSSSAACVNCVSCAAAFLSRCSFILVWPLFINLSSAPLLNYSPALFSPSERAQTLRAVLSCWDGAKMNLPWKRLSVQTQIGGPRLALLLIGGDISISSCYTVWPAHQSQCWLPDWSAALCLSGVMTPEWPSCTVSGEGSRLTLGKHTGQGHFLCSQQPSLWWY